MTRKAPPPYVVRPRTAVVSRGYDPRLSVGSARPAVFRSSTYVFQSPESAERAFAVALGKIAPVEGESVDLIYSRLSHPNAEILEDHLVALEPFSRSAAVFNSGMAAISTLFLAACHPGQAFVHSTPLYGGTHHLIHQLLVNLGLVPIAVPAGDTKAMRKAIASTKDLRLVFLETPANPTLVMADIGAAVEEAKRLAEPPIVAVDNTFLGPAFQHPLSLGADLAVYSATKFLAGFSDMLGGVIIGQDPALVDRLRGLRAILGNILQPDECWLLDSRLPTVELRMGRQGKNATRIVDALEGHPGIERIHFPSRFDDPEQARIRDAQCRYPGAIFSIEVKGGRTGAFEVLRRLRLFKNAVSLGGMESLACHPASTTHSEMSPDELRAAGISDSLLRFSVGVEDWRDLLADLKQAI